MRRARGVRVSADCHWITLSGVARNRWLQGGTELIIGTIGDAKESSGEGAGMCAVECQGEVFDVILEGRTWSECRFTACGVATEQTG